jgi:TonB family protein
MPRPPLFLACLLLALPACAGWAQSRAAKAGAGKAGLGFSLSNVTEAAGIRFRHDNAASKDMFLPETMGSGCAWIDYDGDGLLDLFFVQSGPTPGYQPPQPLHFALYRNRGDGSFEDVTEQAGLGAPVDTFGMGVAVGDFDNDGKPDLYVTGFPRSHLYHNLGGRFEDVTGRAGVANNPRWATSAAWFDYDNDGRLDLIVANYLDWDYGKNVYCGEQKPGYRSYCAPAVFAGIAPTLYHNNGDGTFTDVTRSAGLGGVLGKGLGVVAADFRNDGHMDVIQSNDSVRNFYYRNQGNGKFSEEGVEAGIAYGEEGRPEAGMGIDAGDYDHQGRLDVYITHLDMELHRLFHNSPQGTFSDETYAAQMARKMNVLSGFGTKFADMDNDGWLDLLQINGHILPNIHLYKSSVVYAEPKTLWMNNHDGTFRDASSQAGAAFQRPAVGRGLCVADYNNDGALDFAVSNNGGPAELWRNHADERNSWLAFSLEGTKSNRDGVGAKLWVTADRQTQYQQKTGGGSYLSASDPRVFFGLGRAAEAEEARIVWPSGAQQILKNVAARQFITLKEAAGCASREETCVTRMTPPRYPPLARRSQIQGTVTLEVEIGADGAVISARGSGAHPMLVDAAEQNVRTWMFRSGGPASSKRNIAYVYRIAGEPARREVPPAVVLELPDRLELTVRPLEPETSTSSPHK